MQPLMVGIVFCKWCVCDVVFHTDITTMRENAGASKAAQFISSNILVIYLYQENSAICAMKPNVQAGLHKK